MEDVETELKSEGSKRSSKNRSLMYRRSDDTCPQSSEVANM